MWCILALEVSYDGIREGEGMSIVKIGGLNPTLYAKIESEQRDGEWFLRVIRRASIGSSPSWRPGMKMTWVIYDVGERSIEFGIPSKEKAEQMLREYLNEGRLLCWEDSKPEGEEIDVEEV